MDGDPHLTKSSRQEKGQNTLKQISFGCGIQLTKMNPKLNNPDSENITVALTIFTLLQELRRLLWTISSVTETIHLNVD